MDRNEPLFPFTLRRSPRARRVLLRVVPDRGLEVVVPRFGAGQVDIPALLRRHRNWIRDTLERLARAAPPAWSLPDRILLPAVNAAWTVHAMPQPGTGVELRETAGGELHLRGAVDQPAPCRDVLGQWLAAQGRRHLPPWVERLGRELGYPCARVGVRRQRARWGSCSRQGAISLNARLLLLEPDTVRYVLVHELCHTRELNHGPRFWRLVAAACPEYRAHRLVLCRAWRSLPGWA